MGLIAAVDGPNRDIYLSEETVDASIHPIDIYKELRSLRRTDESLRLFRPFLTGHGMDNKGDGKYTERYAKLWHGARIIPFNVSHTLTVVGVIITDDGQEGIACFDRFPLSPTVRVDINYAPQQVEVIIKTVSTGGALLSDERAKLMALPSALDNVTAVLNAAQTTPIHADTRKINDVPVKGAGTKVNPWGPL